MYISDYSMLSSRTRPAGSSTRALRPGGRCAGGDAEARVARESPYLFIIIIIIIIIICLSLFLCLLLCLLLLVVVFISLIIVILYDAEARRREYGLGFP